MDGALSALMLAVSGASSILGFDVIRALRRGMKPGRIIGTVLDFLGVTLSAAAVWGGLLLFAKGETRLCELLCVVSGAVLYIFTVKSMIFKLFYILFENIFKILHFILKILLTPARFLYKIMCVALCKRSTNITENGDDTNAQENRQISRSDGA